MRVVVRQQQVYYSAKDRLHRFWNLDLLTDDPKICELKILIIIITFSDLKFLQNESQIQGAATQLLNEFHQVIEYCLFLGGEGDGCTSTRSSRNLWH